ncbi:Holliday junction branch migration protein RuvA [Desulfurobacterium indicum]|uniref:Holliday junction branch migration complex subunit RuvA n=1 Tax=Desulfurobacterium indicum TaxID=1914305 RepID=A0A1R1MNA8_9BACT|nr:Holliday junction branch migration protein RuvA [Desulfurobacterium indicum]OMH41200.1 Holliday junction DNA helicase RuvA [Desulfurobacterium indicum]
MLDFVKGKVVFKYSDGISIGCGGIGIKVFVPLSVLTKVSQGDKVFLFVKLIFPPEGTPAVYGFETEDERKLFEILTRIPKIGSRTALNILSHFSKQELIKIVEAKDAKTLATVPGLGKKLSERLIFELASKLKTEESQKDKELIEILENLGYPRRDIIKILSKIDTENLSFEEAIKKLTLLLSGGKFGG